MIVLPPIAVLVLALALALLSLVNMEREAENFARAAEEGYERRGQNWFVFFLALVGLLVLAGIVGVGPLAGVIAVEPLR